MMAKFNAAQIGLEPGTPPHTVEPYAGTDRTVVLMEQLASGERGELSVPFRLFIEDIIRHTRERDQLSQLAAIYTYFRNHYTFFPDPRKVELVKDPVRMTAEIIHRGRCVGDCDDASTWLLAAPRTIGIHTKLVRTGFQRGEGRSPLTHVLTVARTQHGGWVVLDPVAKKKTREMLGRITRFK